MKRALLLSLLILTSCAISGAQTCETKASVPAGQAKVGSGSATAHYDGTTTVKGGQAVYVKIKNENVLGVSYEFTIMQDGKPGVTNCTYKAVLPPKSSVVLWSAVFAEPPVAWKISVAVGPESDAGVLTYEVYSKAK